MVENIITHEIHSAAINESNYLLHEPTNQLRNPTLSTLNDIITQDSIDGQLQTKEPDRESMASFRTIHSSPA